MMDEYEQMLRDGLQQAARRRPQLEAVDLAEVMAAPAADEDLVGEAAPMPLKPPAWRRSGVRWAIGVSAAAVAAAMFLVVPGFLVPKPIPAAPMGTPSVPEPAEPTPTAELTPTTQPTPDPTSEPEPGTDIAELTVSTEGWKTYSSPEYPITFMYPPDWELSYSKQSAAVAKAEQLTPAGIVDGCGVDGCAVHLRPPGHGDEGTHVVLMRTGFHGDGFNGPIPGAWLLGTLPDLQVWTSADPTVEPVAATVMMRSAAGFRVGGTPKDLGAPYDYMLSTAGLAPAIAVGEANPLAEHPEASFSFEANGGVPEDQVNTVVTILTSVRENPDFDPTQPAKDSSGRPEFWLRSMDAPSLGLDSSAWKTFDIPEGNVRVRVPPKWKARDYGDGVILFTAPSGYLVEAALTDLTSGSTGIDCRRITEWEPAEESLGASGLTASDANGVARQVELWWQDATWYPAKVGLRLPVSSDGDVLCTQVAIDYGGKHPVSLGSADNLKNPTRAELDQAVAILTSLKRLH